MSKNNGNRALRMIIIDSDRRSRLYLRDHLTELGVRVIGEAEEPKAGIRLIRGLQPDAIVLELPSSESETMETIKMIRDEQLDTGIILSSSESTPQLILSCIRAGAQEFITRPINRQELEQALEHVETLSQGRERSAANRGMIISVFPCKGGVGGTSVVTNLGVTLAQASEGKTVLVDLSFHMGDVGLMLDQSPRFSLVDALESGKLDQGRLKSVVAPHHSGVDVLTCVTSPELSAEITSDLLVEVIGTLCTTYDYVLIDVGRHLDDRTVDALMLADTILLMASQDIITVRNASRYLDIFDRLEIDENKVRLVVNRYHKRSPVSLRDIESALRIETFWTIPNDYQPMSRAIDAGMPTVLEAPRSKVAQSYKDLAVHVADLNEGQLTIEHPVTVGDALETEG
jgi:pilus assembly protein CpaE